MDVLMLSRIQFGATIAFHYIYPPLSIGLGVMLVIMEAAWLKTRKQVYHQMTRFCLNMYPDLVYNLPNPENSLTIYNAASSPKTLGIMLTIACIGMPLVIAYTGEYLLDFPGQDETGTDKLLKICHRDTEAQS